MENTVATLPLNPRHADKIGFFSLFAYTQFMSEASAMKSVFAINELNISSQSSSRSVLLTGLSFLKQEPSHFWYDLEVEKDSITCFLNHLFEIGKVSSVREAVKHCECLKIQYRAIASLHKTKKSLVSQSGVSECCGTVIQEKEIVTLLSAPLEYPEVFPEITPLWALSEVTTACNKLVGQRLLLSRMGERAFSFTTPEGEVFPLDTDVVWMFFPSLLKDKHNLNLKHLISGASTVRQVALLLMLSNWFMCDSIGKVTFLPRVDFSPIAKVTTLKSAVERFGPHVVLNALMWSATSGTKEVILSGSLFPRVKKEFVSPCVNIDRKDFLV